MKLTPELTDLLKADGYFVVKEIPGHGICALFRMAFTWALCVNCNTEPYEGRYCQYEGRYCHKELAEAVKSIMEWNGTGHPPGNWIKFKSLATGDDIENPNFINQ